jgi:hypothetical protein
MQPESSRQSKTSSAAKSIMMADDYADFAVEQECRIGMDTSNIGSGTGSNFYHIRRNNSSALFSLIFIVLFSFKKVNIFTNLTQPLYLTA